jgi:hypothetical protein
VLADICPGERVQEMEGSEEDAEVAWLAACRATKDRSPRFLSCGRDEQEKGGGDEICSASMYRGTMSLGRCWWSQDYGARGPEGREQRRPESSELGRPCTRSQAATREGEREQRNQKRGTSVASRSSRTVSRSPLFICGVHQKGA